VTTTALAGPASRGFLPEPLPLCAHCGLPLTGRQSGGRTERGPAYCCSGCALAHRLTGGAEGHGRATGLLMAVGVGAFLAINVMMLSFVLYSGTAEADRAVGEGWVRWALLLLATPAFVLLGGPFLTRGFRQLRVGRLDTDALIMIGVSAAWLLSARSVVTGSGPLYLDTAMGILLFVTLGRYLEAAARARTTDALAALVRQMPAEAARIRDGIEEKVPITALVRGDRIHVRPGERIPADGVVIEGEASVSQAEITGEPVPVACAPGSRVGACTLNLDGSLHIEVERTGGETTVARIVRLVEEARAGGYPLAPLVDRVAALFVPVVLAIALATFVVWTWRAGMGEGLLNALSVLLIACPCAIGIATPLASTAAAGRAAAAGVLVRSGAVFERLARSRQVFFDKTGTLTTGEMRVASVSTAPGVEAETLLALAASLEAGSEHPIARALADAHAGELLPMTGFRAVPGQGVVGRVCFGGESREVRVGREGFVPHPRPSSPRPSSPDPSHLLPGRRGGTARKDVKDLKDVKDSRDEQQERPSRDPSPGEGDRGGRERGRGEGLGWGSSEAKLAPMGDSAGSTLVHLALDNTWQGTLALRDTPRPSAKEAVASLRFQGLDVEVLSGDVATSVAAFAEDFPGLLAVGELSPEDKLDRLRTAARQGHHPVMVGDGINDAPALSGAAVAVTLESGTDLAREVADVTILGGDLRRLPWLIALSERTLRTAKRNLLWSFSYNTVGVGLAVAGLLHPLFGAVGMIASSLIVVLRSQRLSRFRLPTGREQ
jgi:P-type Cu+ transporter